jgi:oxygen-independent coproporphyrinogen-3 oxidase
MKLYLINHNYRYAAEQMLLTMFPDERPEYPGGEPKGDRAEIALFEAASRFTAVCRLHLGEKLYIGKSFASREKVKDELTKARVLQRIIKLAFFPRRFGLGRQQARLGFADRHTAREATVTASPVRPFGGRGDDKVLRGQRRIPRRARLCLFAANASRSCAKLLQKRDICLYVGIPFCPTRCAYCSFVSQSVGRSMKLIRTIWQRFSEKSMPQQGSLPSLDCGLFRFTSAAALPRPCRLFSLTSFLFTLRLLSIFSPYQK